MAIYEGDIGSSTFAARRRHVTAKVTRHGELSYYTARLTRYRSAMLIAKYSVSSLYPLSLTSSSTNRIMWVLVSFKILREQLGMFM